MKKALPPIALTLLLLFGLTMILKPDLIPLGSNGTVSKAVIIRETRTDKPLSEEWVELFAGAEKLGIPVWDKDVLGKGKKPSEEAKPFLDAAAGKDLPVLVSQWASGKYTTSPCPPTIDELKKATGK